MEIRLTPDQEAHIAALAASTGRSPSELVSEAVAILEQRLTAPRAEATHAPARAAARILELRESTFLPKGETIKSMIEFGRA
jgi:hypothetical protein